MQLFRWLAWTLREGAVLAMIVTLVSETLFINAAMPKFLKHEQPLMHQAPGRVPAPDPGVVDVRVRRAR